jgi:Ca2+-binding RTX toxin-like protein
MFGIQPGHTDHSLSIFGRELTKEATITKEGGGCFGNGKTIIDAGAGDDNILVNTNKDGSVDVFINGEEHNFSAQEAKNLEIRGGCGNDNIVCTGEANDTNFFGFKFSNDPKLTIDGGNGNDAIMGSSGNDTIRGGKGDDIIFGADGNDTIDGGKGSDLILGGNGNDTIHGGKGDDVISGDDGNDKVYGDQGKDVVDGGAGKDWVQGGSKERNFLEEIFDMPSGKDRVNEYKKEPNIFEIMFKGIRG